jgi:hypothetical protein
MLRPKKKRSLKLLRNNNKRKWFKISSKGRLLKSRKRSNRIQSMISRRLSRSSRIRPNNQLSSKEISDQ